MFTDAPWSLALVALTLVAMCGAMSVRTLGLAAAAPDRLVAELRLAQLAAGALAFTAAGYVGLAAAQPGVDGTGLEVTLAFGFLVVALVAPLRDPRAALTLVASAFVGHALVDLLHGPGWLPAAVVPRWYALGCAVTNTAIAALCYLPLARR
jgi:hypothetical protein